MAISRRQWKFSLVRLVRVQHEANDEANHVQYEQALENRQQHELMQALEHKNYNVLRALIISSI